jgi:tyrosinase
MNKSFTRRRFLKAAGAAASVAAIGGSALDIVTPVNARATFLRRDVGGLAASDPVLVSYRKAIKAMQALPSSNPLSWAYQAAIHGTTLSPAQTAWNTCEHGSYFFWSWHRMYLYWFERIIRKMSGDYGWALPYWNWSSPTERQLPAPFRDTATLLYTSHRNASMNSGAGSLPSFDVDYSSAFSLANFTSASGSLEGTPHGAIHVDVGGWMGSVPTAGQDPIFYLHHCNIDRLWNLWLAQGGGRVDPLGDATWKNTQFTFFNENGAQVKMTGCEVLRCAQQLNYTYEGEPPEVTPICLRIIKLPPFERVVLIKLPIPEFVLGDDPITVEFDVKELRQRLAAVAQSREQTLFLELDGVVADRQPGVVWEVYVGASKDKLDRDEKNPAFVGNVALFGSGIREEAHHGGFKPAHFAFPINRAVQAALRTNAERVPITFAPHGVLVDGRLSRPKAESPVRVGSLTLSVETQKRQ